MMLLNVFLMGACWGHTHFYSGHTLTKTVLLEYLYENSSYFRLVYTILKRRICFIF